MHCISVSVKVMLTGSDWMIPQLRVFTTTQISLPGFSKKCDLQCLFVLPVRRCGLKATLRLVLVCIWCTNSDSVVFFSELLSDSNKLPVLSQIPVGSATTVLHWTQRWELLRVWRTKGGYYCHSAPAGFRCRTKSCKEKFFCMLKFASSYVFIDVASQPTRSSSGRHPCKQKTGCIWTNDSYNDD